jgi:hypothetical protein
MTRLALGSLAVALCLLTHASADDAPQRPAVAYDEVNAPFAKVVARATAEKKLIFIEFFLEG